MLEDVDRIEVIRGPGGTIWGANAVNGVINIITKKAQETQGGLLVAGGGSEERGFGGVRYGGKVGENLFYRVYGKAFNRDAAFHSNETDFDDWRMGQAGFRLDWDGQHGDTITAQFGRTSVLTVSDMGRFTERGGMIVLRLVDRKVHFDINIDATEPAGLKLSSQLLRLAKVIHGSQRIQE